MSENQNSIVISKETAEGIIDCLKSFLRNEDCDYGKEGKCNTAKVCRCVDMTLITELENKLVALEGKHV